MFSVRRFVSHSMIGSSPANEPLAVKQTAAIRPQKLRRLPVPALRKTLDGYLKSLQPLLLEDEVHGGPSFNDAYAKRVKLADEFERGIGSVLQERLIVLDKNSPNNWLDDNFWMKKTYHEWRAPLLINSYWWLLLKDDLKIPESARRGCSEKIVGISPWQVRRAAYMVYRTLEFKDRLSDQTLYPETTRLELWLHSCTPKLFSTCRIPHSSCDFLAPNPPTTSDDARRIIVLIHDFLYSVEVYDETWTKINVSDLERRLFACVRDVERRLSEGEMPFKVGILTADDRDRWAQNYFRIQSISPINGESFRKIHESLFCLSLDHFISPTSLSSLSVHPPDSPMDLKDHLHLIRSSYNAHNRFLDKPYTLIVDPLTRAGASGDHSPVDGLVPGTVGEYSVVEGICESAFDDVPENVVQQVMANNQEGWERLEWVTDNALRTETFAAEERAVAMISDSDLIVFWFNDYGADWIKETACLTPDAYIQMALQLAWYRTRGTFTATYETASTRLFHNGRTETIRTLTTDSRNWVLAMTDNTSSKSRKFELLKRAILTHMRLTRDAMVGKGIDRHLLGLQLLLDQDEQAELLQDELFQRSQTWKLSTSGLSAGHYFKGSGFGSPYNDGYGINYLAGPDIIKFGIESKYSCGNTSSTGFQDAIAAALFEMRVICIEGIDSKL